VPFIDVCMLELDDIEEHAEMFEEEEDAEMFNQGWMVIDVDLEDANGTIFRTRILFNEGGAHLWSEGCHSDGFFGKVYDRADDMRVLASIKGNSGDEGDTHWAPEPGVAASFAEHAHLADLPSLYGENSWEPGACDCQFTALLALAMYSVRHNATHGVAASTPSALPLMRTMLCALANPRSAVHADNTVVQVLCSDGLPLETICTYACGRYPILVKSEPFNADGGGRAGPTDGRKEEGPGALDWLLRTNLQLMQAVRHHRAGDDTKAMAAMGKWEGDGDLFTHDFYEDFNYEFGTPLKRLAHVNECIALAEKFSFGLADNEAFWSWIARHSPLAREKAWFKQETLKELRGVAGAIEEPCIAGPPAR